MCIKNVIKNSVYKSNQYLSLKPLVVFNLNIFHVAIEIAQSLLDPVKSARLYYQGLKTLAFESPCCKFTYLSAVQALCCVIPGLISCKWTFSYEVTVNFICADRERFEMLIHGG